MDSASVDYTEGTDMTNHRSRWLQLLAGLLALALVAAACGSDDEAATDNEAATSDESAEPDTTEDESSTSDDATTSEPAEEETEEEPAEEEPVEETASDPVKIGLIAQTEELLAFPEVPAAAQATVDYFNAEGGADGTPIELVVCTAGDAPEGHVSCAQEFVNDDSITLAIAAGFGPNSATAAGILAENGIATLTLGNDFIDYLLPGVFTLDPGLPGLAQVFFVFASDVRGDTTATLFIADDPAFEPFIPALQAIGGSNGIDVNEVVPLGFEPDLTGPVSAANTENDMWLFVLGDGAQCIASATAVDTVGFEGNLYANDLCMGADTIGGGDLDGFVGAIVSSAPTADGGDDAVLLNSILDGGENGGLAGWSMANMFVARDVLIEAGLGDATRESSLAALSAYSSDDVPGIGAVSCPGPSAWTGACNTNPLIVTVDGGALTTPEGFISLDFSELDFLLE